MKKYNELKENEIIEMIEEDESKEFSIEYASWACDEIERLKDVIEDLRSKVQDGFALSSIEIDEGRKNPYILGMNKAYKIMWEEFEKVR